MIVENIKVWCFYRLLGSPCRLVLTFFVSISLQNQPSQIFETVRGSSHPDPVQAGPREGLSAQGAAQQHGKRLPLLTEVKNLGVKI